MKILFGIAKVKYVLLGLLCFTSLGCDVIVDTLFFDYPSREECDDIFEIGDFLGSTEKFEVVWANQIGPLEERQYPADIKVYNDQLIVASGSHLTSYSKMSGIILWKEDFPETRDLGRIKEAFLFGGIYIGIANYGIFALNLAEHKIIWADTYTCPSCFHGYRFTKVNNKLYGSGNRNLYTINQTSEVIEIDPDTGNQRVVYSVSGNEGEISSIAIYDEPMFQDKILIANIYPSLDTAPGKAVQNLVAINISTQEQMWKVENLSKVSVRNIEIPPVIHNSTVITGADWSMVGFDLFTGLKLWQTKITTDTKLGNKRPTKHLLIEDKLFVKDIDDILTCLNPNNGEIYWEKTGIEKSSKNMFYDEGKALLLVPNRYISILEANTGSVYRTVKSNDCSDFLGDIVSDPNSNMYFSNTNMNMVGFELH